ncbi:hypothetical protein DCO58_01725 [Helicobacter saguini]|uniref:Uncharacterized protein n=1 Tax=Helicobacter saguini TaxID=1548018 RepID=A0A4U8T4M2_9HELI|nr:hypothetical protein [Helicobacter saguini]MWV62899.1 hypothetical protein [Helicobacter saguini]MWV66431.1 hypothetical protein [Helicobacter saguini]MWV68781.1 hypothetical protein [Helicobacter saguini]MWV71664.1 hypothetical protein [Helicobacter saguini]TLD94466.1 hypothetical protein LS64_005940 [Helicobacter saguini]
MQLQIIPTFYTKLYFLESRFYPFIKKGGWAYLSNRAAGGRLGNLRSEIESRFYNIFNLKGWSGGNR